MGTHLSKFALPRQALFAQLHGRGRQNAAVGSKRPSARATLAQNLKALMDHLGASQGAIGHKMGMAQSTVGRILKQKHAPDLDTLESLADAVGVSLWQLMVPRLDPTNPPVLQNASPEERELYDRLRAAAEVLSRKHQ